MRTAIMTDTNSGIYKDIAKEMGIYVIHMPVIIDNETFYEGDTIGTVPKSLYFASIIKNRN